MLRKREQIKDGATTEFDYKKKKQENMDLQPNSKIQLVPETLTLIIKIFQVNLKSSFNDLHNLNNNSNSRFIVFLSIMSLKFKQVKTSINLMIERFYHALFLFM